VKILQLIQKPQLRGAEIFSCQLSNHLQRSHHVSIVSLFPGDVDLPFNGGVKNLNRPISKRLRDFQGWRELANFIQKEKPDIVQANAGDTLKFAVLSKLFYKWKVPIVFRNANKMGDFVDSKIKLCLNKFFVSRIDYVISVSQLCEVDFKNTFNYPSSRITTVPIGVEEQQVPATPPDDLKEIFAHYKVVVNVGSLVPEKNHEGLLRVFNELASSDNSLFLIIIGDGKTRGVLEEQAASYSCNNRILFAGFRNDVLQVVRHSQAFLMPSFIEGLPGVILEAMYCKTPVVANNVGGISEVVDCATGWLIEKGNERAFLKAIQEVLQNDEKVREKTERAYQRISKSYLNSNIAKKFEEVYYQVTMSV
jgi:glycosyltransferase involved in cell wall biosynthesis